MKRLKILLAVIVMIILMTSCKSKKTIAFKESQPTQITEPAGVRPHYHWESGSWKWSRKHKMVVWDAGQWVNKRKHTKWVKGHWVTTGRGKQYMEGHWE
jgi:hypothetical protein